MAGLSYIPISCYIDIGYMLDYAGIIAEKNSSHYRELFLEYLGLRFHFSVFPFST